MGTIDSRGYVIFTPGKQFIPMGDNVGREIGLAVLGKQTQFSGGHYGHILFKREEVEQMFFGFVYAGGHHSTLAQQEPTSI